MSSQVKYGDAVLGVEAALPVALQPVRRGRPAQRFIHWLAAVLRRRA